MCLDVTDKAVLDTKISVPVQASKISSTHRACFCSTGFVVQSLFFPLAHPVLFIGLGSLPDQVPRSAARLSQHSLLISKAFMEDLRKSF